jgi:hypothetical protein
MMLKSNLGKKVFFLVEINSTPLTLPAKLKTP